MDDTEHRASTDGQSGTTTDEQQADRLETADAGPANPSSEPEDRPKSPVGGADYDNDAVDVDPENAPSANSFMVQVTVAMFVVVALLVLTAITGSTILLALALASILIGLGFVLKAIFTMMSTD